MKATLEDLHKLDSIVEQELIRVKEFANTELQFVGAHSYIVHIMREYRRTLKDYRKIILADIDYKGHS